MCLDTLGEFKASGKGWKEIARNGSRFMSPYMHATRYKKTMWNYDRKKYKIECARSCAKYKTGFHIWIKNPHIDNYYVKRVEYRNVVATGYQNDRRVVVARKFKFITEEV